MKKTFALIALGLIASIPAHAGGKTNESTTTKNIPIPDLDLGISAELATKILGQSFTPRPIRTNPSPNMPELNITTLPSGTTASFKETALAYDSDTPEESRTTQISPRPDGHRTRRQKKTNQRVQVNCLGLLKAPTVRLAPSDRETTRTNIKPLKKIKKRQNSLPFRGLKLPHVYETGNFTSLNLPIGLLDTQAKYDDSRDKLDEINERIREKTQEVTDNIKRVTFRIRQARVISSTPFVIKFIDEALDLVVLINRVDITPEQTALLKILSYEIGFGRKTQSGKLLTKKGSVNHWVQPKNIHHLAHFNGSDELVKKIEIIQAIVTKLIDKPRMSYLKLKS